MPRWYRHELVLVRSTAPDGSSSWIGPFEVDSAVGDHLCALVIPGAKPTESVWSNTDLRSYTPPFRDLPPPIHYNPFMVPLRKITDLRWDPIFLCHQYRVHFVGFDDSVYEWWRRDQILAKDYGDMLAAFLAAWRAENPERSYDVESDANSDIGGDGDDGDFMMENDQQPYTGDKQHDTDDDDDTTTDD